METCYANDIVTVKPGYANNYLIPQVTQRLPPHPPRRCSPRTSASAPTRDAKILADAQALAETIANLPLTLP